MSANAQGHVGRRKFDPLVFSLNKSQLKTGGLCTDRVIGCDGEREGERVEAMLLR